MNETKQSTGKNDNIQHMIDRLKILDNQRWLVTQWEKNSPKGWPSMQEVCEGVIFESNKIDPSHEAIWRRLFECPGDQIQWHTLDNPSCDLVAQFMYIYSLQTFLPDAINRATVQKDASKIATLGPFARILHQILNVSEINKKAKDRVSVIYRPANMDVKIFEKTGEVISLLGYTSFTKDKSFAFNMATKMQRKVVF